MGSSPSPQHPAEYGMTDEDFRRMLESVKDYAIILLNPDGNIVSWNAGAEAILGYRAEEAIGQHFSIFYPPDAVDQDIPYRLLLMAEQEGRSEDENWRMARDGRRFWATVSITAFRKQDGTLRGYAEVLRDMSERRSMEEALSKFRAGVEQTIDGVALLDSNWRITFSNQAMARMHGYETAEVIGQNASIFHTTEQMDREIKPLIGEAERSGAAEGEVGHMRRDGSTFPGATTVTLLKNQEGESIGFVVMTRDITESKRMNQVLQRQAREILEISTPVIQVWEGVLVVPLIGTLDSQRTEQLMERLLEGIVTTRSSVALVDITAVPTIDTQTGRHLLDTIAATRLLGADVILTGVRPAIAQTLVHLGIDLSTVITRSSLAAGLRVALDRVGLRIDSKLS